MVDFFLSLDKTVQVALIALCSAVLVAIINGIFSILNNKKSKLKDSTESDKVSITQTANGHHNTFIGIQNPGKDNK